LALPEGVSRSGESSLKISVRLILTLLPVALLTLVPGEPWGSELFSGPTLCILCGETALADAVLNTFLFLPFGWVMGRRSEARQGRYGSEGGAEREAPTISPGRRVRDGVLWSAAISVAIEIIQMFLPGRFSSVADVLANTLGGGLGAWAGSRERIPVASASALVGVGLLAPAFLLAPAPPPGVYYGQWTAVFENMEAYGGRVLDARVNGVSVPSGRSSQAEGIRQGLRRGDPVKVKVRLGAAPSGGAPVFSIADGQERQMFMLGVAEDDIFVHLWRRGSSLGFQTPSWWWPGALRGLPVGDTVQIIYALGDGAPCLSVQDRTRCLRASSAVGGWSLFTPDAWGYPLLGATGLTWALFLGIPLGMLPLGFRGRTLGTVGLLLGVALLSWALPYWVTPWWGMLLVFSGMVVTSLKEPWIREKLGR
jgi:hypothetical protein